MNRKREFISELPKLYEVYSIVSILQTSKNVFKIIAETDDACWVSEINLQDEEAVDQLKELLYTPNTPPLNPLVT